MRRAAAISLATLAATLGPALGPEALGAQAIVGLEKRPKRAIVGPAEALGSAGVGEEMLPLLTEASHAPEVVLTALVRLIHEPLKVVGLQRFDEEGRHTLKSAMRLAEDRLRTIVLAAARGRADLPGLRSEVERVLEEYRSVLAAEAARATVRRTGAARP
jgi:hypothetical protein